MGHAIPDLEIMQQFSRDHPRVTWEFVSYGTGARTIESFGIKVSDLSLSEDNSIVDTFIAASKIIFDRRPRFVVSHEEPAAVAAASVFDVPSIFVIDWFVQENHIRMQPLTYAQAVLFMGTRGAFDEPSYLRNKVTYLGAYRRAYQYSQNGRNKARKELNIDPSAFVVSCMPGGWATEERAPIADFLLAAFRILSFSCKHLFWVAGTDVNNILRAAASVAHVTVLERIWPPEQLKVASDVVITKGNRGTTLEAAQLGIPSVSLSHGLNPIEDVIIPRIQSNLPLRVKGLSSDYLQNAFVIRVFA